MWVLAHGVRGMSFLPGPLVRTFRYGVATRFYDLEVLQA